MFAREPVRPARAVPPRSRRRAAGVLRPPSDTCSASTSRSSTRYWDWLSHLIRFDGELSRSSGSTSATTSTTRPVVDRARRPPRGHHPDDHRRDHPGGRSSRSSLGVISGVRRDKPIDFVADDPHLRPDRAADLLVRGPAQGGRDQVQRLGRARVLYTIGERDRRASSSTARPSEIFKDRLLHLILPTISLGVADRAGWSRYQRASTLDVLDSDYMRLARAKGVRYRTVIRRHGLRNALIPLMTVVAIDIGALFGGAIITEKVYVWHGMGEYLNTALGDRGHQRRGRLGDGVGDLRRVFNLIADLLYAVLDPRIRLAERPTARNGDRPMTHVSRPNCRSPVRRPAHAGADRRVQRRVAVAGPPGAAALPAQPGGDDRADRLRRSSSRSLHRPVLLPVEVHDRLRKDAGQLRLSVQPGTAGHLLGTDEIGHDLLARMMRGIQRDFIIVIIATAHRAVHRHPDRRARRLLRQVADNVLMRFVDIILTVPMLVVLIIVVRPVPERRTAHWASAVLLGLFGWMDLPGSCAPSSCRCGAGVRRGRARAGRLQLPDHLQAPDPQLARLDPRVGARWSRPPRSSPRRR